MNLSYGHTRVKSEEGRAYLSVRDVTLGGANTTSRVLATKSFPPPAA